MLDPLKTEFVVFDVETTGLSVTDGDRIIEIAAARLREGKIIDRFTTFVDPLRALNPEAMKTNHITEKMILGAPKAVDVLPRFVEFVGSTAVVAHNASFDVKFVSYELSLYGRRMREDTPVIDTLKMARALLPQLTSFRLDHLANSLGVRVKETHRAMADVELLAEVFQKLLYMTEDHNLRDLREIYARFTVEKPSFRVRHEEEASLF